MTRPLIGITSHRPAADVAYVAPGSEDLPMIAGGASPIEVTQTQRSEKEPA